MSGSYSGVDTFHTSMTTIENGDAAIGSTFNAPDKQLFDNTLNLKGRVDDAVVDIAAHETRIDTAESDIDTLQSSLTTTQGTLSATVSTVNDQGTELTRRRVPGQLYGGFTGSFAIGAAAMITLTSVTETGDSTHRPDVVSFDSAGTPQANKVLKLPAGGVYNICYQISGTITSTSSSFSRLQVQSYTTDAFTSPTDLIDEQAPLVTAAPKVRFGAPLTIRTTVDLYIRFLLTTPAADTITIDSGRLSAVCIGETV